MTLFFAAAYFKNNVLPSLAATSKMADREKGIFIFRVVACVTFTYARTSFEEKRQSRDNHSLSALPPQKHVRPQNIF